jgi:3-oxoacyl-[acyl-carrier protein] reductase
MAFLPAVRMPAGRIGTPADIAHALSFLASEAGFITGQRLVVDADHSLGS